MNWLTFAQAKAEIPTGISGTCPDKTEFARLVNKATRKLMRRGDFAGTVVPIHVCVKNGCVVMPRYVDTIRKVNRCDYPLPVRSLWYQFLPLDVYRSWCGTKSWVGARAFGFVPTYNSVFGDGRLIRAYPQEQEDVGKTITLFGTDNNDQPLRTNNGDGTWSDGITLTLALPFVSTSTYVRSIDRVVREVTQTRTLLYAYDAANNALEDLAVYEPGETNPTYARYQLSAGCGCGAGGGCCGGTSGSSCGTSRSILTLVKLKFIEAKFDNDLVLIPNVDALGLMIQGIRAEEAGDLASAREFEMSAVRELNLELRDLEPDDQTAVLNQPFAGTTVGYPQCF